MNADLLNRLDTLCQPYGCTEKTITATDLETIRQAKAELGRLYDIRDQALKRLDGQPYMMLDSLKYILSDAPAAEPHRPDCICGSCRLKREQV